MTINHITRFLERHGTTVDVNRTSNTQTDQGGIESDTITVEEDALARFRKRSGGPNDELLGDKDISRIDKIMYVLPTLDIEEGDEVIESETGNAYKVLSVNGSEHSNSQLEVDLEEIRNA